MIELINVDKSFGDTRVIDGLDLVVGRGELVVLLGESGCGKTTALKMINRLIEPTSGTITVDGQDISQLDPVELRRSIGYVFQGIGLFPHLTVAENVAVVPNLLGWAKDKTEARVAELLELIGLPEVGSRLPTQLSGGQQQRIGVARALAAKPNIVLMDEPFGALDPITRDSLQKEFSELHQRLGLTTVLVTHDMLEALILADRIAVMRSGAILQIGSPAELIRRPVDDYVSELMRRPREQASTIDRLMEMSGE